MIQKIFSSYLADRNYLILYLIRLCRSFASAGMYIFAGAYFLKLGMPLHFVLLFYGFEFGLRGALCPLGTRILHKFSLTKALLISVCSEIIFFTGISLADQNLIVGFCSLLFAAFAGGIFYPLSDVLEAIFIKEDENRAKQYSMSLVFNSIGSISGAASIGFLLAHYGFTPVLVAISFFLLLIVFLFSLLPAKENLELPKLRNSDVYRFMMGKNFRNLWKPFFGEQLTIIFRCVMVPVFIYTTTQKIDELGYIMALALIGQNICTLVAGHLTDRHGTSKTLSLSFLPYTVSMLSYVFLASTPLSLFLTETLHKTSINISMSAFQTGVQKEARKKFKNSMILFGTSWQMSLCFAELLTLPAYALIAYFMGIKIFYVTAFLAILGLWMMKDFYRKESYEEEAENASTGQDKLTP